MSQALYRRYRPDNFAQMIGQEQVTAPLMQALRSNRVNHAYLFSGPRGCGKTTSARILARILNCHENTEASPTDTPCEVCPSCIELARGGSGSLDVVEIDAASHGGVEDARELRERATFSPSRDRFKIFILDEAHMVTAQGFNALLKIVEEPPSYLKFIFATTEPDKVIGTIRSRTHHYPFKLVGPAAMQGYLERLCTAENIAVGSGVLPLVVRAGGGSVRDTLSVLDQLMAGSGAEGIEYDRAVGLLGFTPVTLLDDVVEALAARDGASMFRVVEQVISTGHEPRRFVEDLLERLRDLVIISLSGDNAQTVLNAIPQDQFARMTVQASNLGASELSRSADVVNDALSSMTGATSPRLHLELLCARLLLPAADASIGGLGARIDGLERAVATGGVALTPSASGAIAPAAVGGGAVGSDTSGTGAPSAPRKSLRPDSTRTPVKRPESTRIQRPSAASVPPVAAPSEPGLESGSAAVASSAVHTSGTATVPAPNSAPAVPSSAPSTDGWPAVVAPGTAPATPQVVAPAAPQFAAPATSQVTSPIPPGEPVAAVMPEKSVAPAAPVAPAEPVAPAGPVTPAAPTEPVTSAPAMPVAPTAPVAAAEPVAPAGNTNEVQTEALRRRWPEVLEALAGMRRATWTLVNQHAQIAGLTAESLLLAFPSPGLVRTFENMQGPQLVQGAVSQTLGFEVRVVGQVGSATPPPAVPAVMPPAASPVAPVPARPVTPPAAPAMSVAMPPVAAPAVETPQVSAPVTPVAQSPVTPDFPAPAVAETQEIAPTAPSPGPSIETAPAAPESAPQPQRTTSFMAEPDPFGEDPFAVGTGEPDPFAEDPDPFATQAQQFVAPQASENPASAPEPAPSMPINMFGAAAAALAQTQRAESAVDTQLGQVVAPVVAQMRGNSSQQAIADATAPSGQVPGAEQPGGAPAQVAPWEESPRQIAERQAAQRELEEAQRVKVIDDPQPDDEDLESSNFVGVPLIIKKLGGVVIEEVTDAPY